MQQEAQSAGYAEAEQVKAFMGGLAEQVPDLADRISVWQTLRKKDALSAVAQGGASLYYTPNDVDLSINASHVK